MNETSSTPTFPEALSREIERVAVLRETYIALGENVGSPAAFMMRAALDRAHAAIGLGDLAGQVQALIDLRGFND